VTKKDRRELIWNACGELTYSLEELLWVTINQPKGGIRREEAVKTFAGRLTALCALVADVQEKD